MVTGTCSVLARRLKTTLPIRREVVGYWSKNRLGVETAVCRRMTHLGHFTASL
jgi:hypothetical protein